MAPKSTHQINSQPKLPASTTALADDDYGSIVDDNANSCTSSGTSDDSSLKYSPFYQMSAWRHPRTRDGQFALIVLLSSGAIDANNGLRASVEDGNKVIV